MFTVRINNLMHVTKKFHGSMIKLPLTCELLRHVGLFPSPYHLAAAHSCLTRSHSRLCIESTIYVLA